jgi:hypothetical protein
MLPAWLPDLHLKGLRLDAKLFDIRFWRKGESTLWEVTRGDAKMVESRPFARGPDIWSPAPAGPVDR